MNKFSSKISLNVHDNIWQLWLFIREFPIAAVLKVHHLKVILSQKLVGLVEYKILPLENKKRSKDKNVKKHVKKLKNVFYIYGLLALMN